MGKLIVPPFPNLGWPVASYRASDAAATIASSAPSTAALATFLPFVVPRPVNIVRIGFYLVTAQAGAECRLGLYADNNGVPGALIVDGGIVDLSSGGGAIKEATINVTLAPGVVWVCCQLKNVATQVTVVRMSAAVTPLLPVTAAILAAVNGVGRYYQQSITYGSALPDPAGAVTVQAGTDCPATVLRSA